MIRGTKRELHKPPTKQFNVNASIHNRFDIEVIDSTSGQVKDKAYAENVICEQLWTRMFEGSSWNWAIQYGDGTGTPSSSDKSLFSYLGYITSTVHNMEYDYDNDVFVCTKKAVIDEVTAVGKTLTEVGIAYSKTQDSLVTHAMLKDMNGNPVSLKKSDTDIFNIYATVFLHLNMPSEHVRMLGSYRYNKTWREYGMLQYFVGLDGKRNMGLQFTVGTIPYTTSATFKTITPTCDASAHTVTYTADRLAATNWNMGGLQTFMITYDPRYAWGGTPQMVLDVDPEDGWYGSTPVIGESIGTGDGVTVDFATAFGFAKNAKVYVDGVEVHVEVDYVNHALQSRSGTYKGLAEYPILSYFRLLRLPEIGYGNRDGAMSTPPIVYFDNKFSPFQIREYPAVFENTTYKTHGVKQISGRGLSIWVSNDLKNWVTIVDNRSDSKINTSVPEEYQHYRYWAYMCYVNNQITYTQRSIEAVTNVDLASITKNLHLSEAPAEGAVITADYDAVCVAKDENHVFDLSIVFKFNEYTEAQ